jgi:hypothetical protein
MILVSRDDMYMLSGCELIDTENHLQKKGCLHKRTPTIHKIKNIADYVTKKWQDRDSVDNKRTNSSLTLDGLPPTRQLPLVLISARQGTTKRGNSLAL